MVYSIAACARGNLMRLPMLMSLLAAVPGAAAAQTAIVVAPAATVPGVTVTNAGTYRAQSVSAPSGAKETVKARSQGTGRLHARHPGVPWCDFQVVRARARGCEEARRALP